MDIGRWNRIGNAAGVAVLMVSVALFAPVCAATGTGDDSSHLSTAERVTRLEPAIIAFVEQCDRDVVAQGRPLTDDEIQMAREVGVLHPERVRILVSDEFPQPDDPVFAAQISDLGPSNPLAETTGYGIQITHRVAHTRRILMHELTHVGQFERLGVEGFMHEYVGELTTVGYGHSTLEAQAKANEGR